jgi:hypothetical protein
VIIHAFYLGSDFKSGLLREIFIWANGILVLLLFSNLLSKIYAHLRQSNPASREKRGFENFRRRI